MKGVDLAMNHSNVKPTTKKRAKAVLSVFLVVAILIAGAYAFLSATDSKTNVFTVGNVDIELHEIFNGRDYGKGEDPGAIGDKIENIVPGQSIEKAPYVVNTGKNPAYTFIAVGIPTDTSDNVYNGQGTYTAKSELDIKVKAYAIQEQYNGATDAESTWTNYFKNDMISGTASDAGIELFTLNDGTSAVTTGTHTIGSDWQEFSTPYSVTDGGNTYTYHFFKYVANNELLPVGTTTAHLFDKVVFNGNIGGDKPPEPITLNYYKTDGSVPDGYVLVQTEEYLPGSVVSDLYYDNTLAKTGYSFDWKFANNTEKSAYSGMIITEDTNLIADYTNETESSNPQASSYLFYSLYWDEELQNFAAIMTGADKTNSSYPSSPTTVIVPSHISFTRISENEYVIDEGVYREIEVPEEKFTKHQEKISIGTKYTVPVVKAQIDSRYSGMLSGVALREIAKKIVFADNLRTLGQILQSVGGLDTEKSSSTLEEVVMPYSCDFSATSFEGQKALKSVKIPNTAKSITNNCFSGTALTEITIPQSVESIFSSAFANCEQLTTISILGEVKISREAFKNCKNLTSITLPNSMETIEYSTFSNCSSLTDIIIPNSVTSIGDSAFENCTSLVNIKVPDSLTSISSTAFINTGYYNNQNNWDNEVLYLGKHLIRAGFSEPIETYTVKKDTKSLAGNAFLNQNIKNIDLPDGLISIGKNAFSGCVNLTNVKLPNSITNIGIGAFESCSNLTSLVIPKGVTRISTNTFRGCLKLTNIEIPNTVTNIGYGAFLETNLQTITIPISLQSVDGFLFGNNIPKTIIYQGSISQFKSIQNYYCIGKSGTTINCSDGQTTI